MNRVSDEQPLNVEPAAGEAQAASRRRALARLGRWAAGGLILPVAAGVSLPALAAEDKGEEDDTFDQDSVLKDAADFFGETTEGLAKVIEKAFKEQGRPNAYIKGQEAGAAITVGLRYGDGSLVMKRGGGTHVYWAGPSVGFDLGANASKVFTLVYKLPKASAIFRRFPGVDGSLYYVGGAGINYQRADGITLAPIRLGVGLRAGASVGYIHYRREKTYNPF
ncbi:DUF1134 domain-containing protein [Roseateles terrae]|uniref:DUF1134 domain-containing protein n=1 Tax=Roseateles terrae TaxID=431060 RepID=A0ABR6GYX5_9BURK|nr:DUF1134 domain-containing protein [Roseateles terrae]MBB3197318.1 hypothetical protein [Roseateles terrae]OWQ83741.1 hypothetical protein CDN98_21500 [Roseateles terrae]